MKNICLQILLCLGLLQTCLAQDCIPDTLILSTQQEIDDFPTNYPSCTNVLGTIIISAPDLTDLNGLDQLVTIEKELIFSNNTFTDLSNTSLPNLSNLGFPNSKITFVNNPLLTDLTGIGEYLDGRFDTIAIENNPALTDMSGFDSDGDIENNSTLRIANNPQLISLEGMQSLQSVNSSTLHITDNPNLLSLDGLNSITILDELLLTNNISLNDLSGLSQLTTFDKGLTIQNCESLTDFQGLENLASVPDGQFVIDDNNSLTSLNGLQNLTSVNDFFITNNPNLLSLANLNDLTAVNESLIIFNNAVLQNLNGLGGVIALQRNLRLEDLPVLTDLQGLSNLESVNNNFVIENIALSIPDLSDFQSLQFIGGNLELTQTGFTTLNGLENIETINGRLYIQQNDVLVHMQALSNLTSIGDNLIALRFNDIITSLDGLQNIDPNSIDSLNLFSNDLLEFCSQQNICAFLANGGGSLIDDNLPASTCSDAVSISANCSIVDPKIVGTIYIDDGDCINDAETPLNDAIVRFEDSDGSFTYATSDVDGKYDITVPEGTYTVSVINFSADCWQICNNNVSVTVTDNQQFEQDLGLSPLILCPKLNVDISGGSLVPCEPITYKVNYCNNGTIEATNVEVDIELGEGFSFTGSSNVVIAISGNTYTLQAADAAVNQCQEFELTAIYDPSCNTFVTGQTACITARIRPNEFCLPPSPTWDESSLRVEGFCDGDSVRFNIINTGQAMTSTSDYIIIEDDILMLNGNFDLPPNDTLSVAVPAAGTTFRIETDQTDGHPGFSQPTISVEGCDPDGDNIYSLGFYKQYPQDDIDAFVDIECMEVLETFYVNEKNADPLGATEEHCLPKGIPIEYTIHFQNTGTAVVSEVIIQEELSPLLDVASLQAGASSHDYDFELIDDGLVQFTFPDINLPDSTTDAKASRGFVSFKIGQQVDLPTGSLIQNQAVVLFDSIPTVVYDEQVFHMVEDFYCIDTVWVGTKNVFTNQDLLEVYPNPFKDFTIFEWKDKDRAPNGNLQIIDVAGRVIRTMAINEEQTIFKKDKLSPGIYFYELRNEENLLMNTGKLIMF
ncbi:MAG: T9SS type A sorting domain-containing protein [Saprospiraceae bacterium]